jgi:hypothetical protein
VVLKAGPFQHQPATSLTAASPGASVVLGITEPLVNAVMLSVLISRFIGPENDNCAGCAEEERN